MNKLAQSERLETLLFRESFGEEEVVFIGRKTVSRSYRQIMDEARAIAYRLTVDMPEKGLPVMILYTERADFSVALLGCILSGHIAVPLAVPSEFNKENMDFRNLRSIWNRLNGPPILTTEALSGQIGAWEPRAHCIVKETIQSDKLVFEPVHGQPDRTVIMLSTSGTTGQPKIVELSHQNIITSIRGSILVNQYQRSETSLNWLPMCHIGALMRFIRDFSLGCRIIQVDQNTILQDPLNWLDIMHQERVTLSWAPNFAFNLVLQALEKTPQHHQLDLSCVKSMYSSGEQVSRSTMLSFYNHLKHYGLKKNSIHMAWGMTEACFASYTHTLIEDLETEVFAPIGRPIPGVSMRVVDDRGEAVREGETGHFQIQGPLCGRHLGALESSYLTEDGWMRTGDLCLVKDDQYILKGRHSDTIIINGVNIAAVAVEDSLRQIPELSQLEVAVCSVALHENDSRLLAVFFNADLMKQDGKHVILKLIKRQVSRFFGISPNWLVALKSSDFPKTKLGKIRRSILREKFEKGVYREEIQSLHRDFHPTMKPCHTNHDIQKDLIAKEVEAIFSDVLELSQMCPHDDFFSCGGTSLKTVHVIHALERAFPHVPLTIVELFKYPTVALFSDFIRNRHGDKSVSSGQKRADIRRSARSRRKKNS